MKKATKYNTWGICW